MLDIEGNTIKMCMDLFRGFRNNDFSLTQSELDFLFGIEHVVVDNGGKLTDEQYNTLEEIHRRKV